MANQGEFILNHNIVGYLTYPPSEYGIFKSMVRVLNSCKITKALKENPVMYRDLILEFWANAKIVKSQTKVESIMSKVKETEVIVTEDVIRRVLEFGDQPDFPHAFADNEVEETLRMMSYEGDTFTKFYKKKFPPYWRFLIHTFQVSFAPRSTGVDVLNKSLVHAIVAFVRDLNFNFSYFIFDEMKRYVKKSNHNLVLYPRFVQLILNELYPYIPRSGDTVDLKGIDPDIFRRMCVNRHNKDGIFTGRYPLVKFGKFANLKGENDQDNSAADQNEVVEVVPTQPVIAEVSAPIQSEVTPELHLSDQNQDEEASEPPVYIPRLPNFVLAPENEDTPLTNEDVENMLISDLFALDPVRLQSVISDQASLPPMELSDIEEVHASLNLNEPAQPESESPEPDSEESESESVSDLVSRKRKRSELDVQEEETSVVEPSSIIPEIEAREDAAEDMLEKEKENDCAVEMELDQSPIQEEIVEKETVTEKENVEVETESQMEEEPTPTTAAVVPPVQDKSSGKAIVVEDSISNDIPSITLDQMFKRSEDFPVDQSVGGSGAGGSGVSRSPQRPISPSFPENEGVSDSDSDFDDADDDFEDTRQGRFLRKVIEEKDLLIGTMDIRLHEVEESNAAKTAEIASLKSNLGNLTASFIALQQLLCQRLGNEFNFDSIPLPTSSPASQPLQSPPSSSTPQPPPQSSTQPTPSRTATIVNRFDPNMEKYVQSVPDEALRRKKGQAELKRKKEKAKREKERLKEQARKEKAIRQKVKKIVQDSDIVIMKDRNHRIQSLGGHEPDSFIMSKKHHITDKQGDKTGVKYWGYDANKKLFYVKRNSLRIEHFENKVDFFSFTQADLHNLVRAPFYNPSLNYMAFNFKNFLEKQSETGFKGLKLAKSWTRPCSDVMQKNSDKPFKIVVWPPTKKLLRVPIDRPLPDGFLRFMAYWVYDSKFDSVEIRLPNNQQIHMYSPNDLFRFDENDIRMLATHELQITVGGDEGGSKAYTSMVRRIIDSRLWFSARKGADVHVVPLLPPPPEPEVPHEN